MVCQESFDDIEFARSLFESCGIILPYGILTEIYDEMGFRYKLPPYCICDPIFLENDELSSNKESSQVKPSTVKIRLSDGKDIVLDLHGEELVSDIKRILRKQENLCSKQRIVVLWCGKLLDDEVCLSSLNLPKNSVLQVMLP